MTTLAGEVEVCMGGKCRKNGAEEILAQLESRATELNISVTGCRKCMGKCKVAPNLRLWKGEAEEAVLESSVDVAGVSLVLDKHFKVEAAFS